MITRHWEKIISPACTCIYCTSILGLLKFDYGKTENAEVLQHKTGGKFFT
jgi:hypothetical protein